MDTIVVGTDGSTGSRGALRWAVREAELRGAELLVVHGWQVPAVPEAYMVPSLEYEEAATTILAEAVQTAREMAAIPESLSIRSSVVNLRAEEALIDASEHAQLLVVGSRGHGAFAGLLLGSVSLHCASHAACPVVIVRPQADPHPD